MRPLLFCYSFLTICLTTACDDPEPIATDALISELATDAGIGSAQPHLARNQAGTVILSWLEPHLDGTALKASLLGDDSWQPPTTVASGSDWFVNWADFPSVIPLNHGDWAAHWLVKSGTGTYAYDVVIALSKDQGHTFSDAISPHRDGTQTEHGFVSLFPTKQGVGAIWLDGRNMSAVPHEQNHSGHDHGTGGMTLRGAVLQEDQTLAQEQLIDELVCDCCQTDVATTATGAVAVYRNRSENEIRDIYLTRYDGNSWSKGREVAADNWQIAGCPVNGPAVAAVGNHIAVTWFTAANDEPKIRFATSEDGGNTFSAPIDIAADKPLGRVDVVMLPDLTAIVSFMRRAAINKTGEAAEIVITSISDGNVLSPILIATTDASRPSGFPQMIELNDNLLFAWTDTNGEDTQIRSAMLPVSKLRARQKAK